MNDMNYSAQVRQRALALETQSHGMDAVNRSLMQAAAADLMVLAVYLEKEGK